MPDTVHHELEVFLLRKKARHFAGVKYVIDVLKEGLVGNLGVGENE